MIPKYLAGIPEHHFDAAISLDVNPSWEPIVRAAVERIIELAPDIKINQIKNKFNGLRLYVDRYDDAVESIIRDAEFKIMELENKHG